MYIRQSYSMLDVLHVDLTKFNINPSQLPKKPLNRPLWLWNDNKERPICIDMSLFAKYRTKWLKTIAQTILTFLSVSDPTNSMLLSFQSYSFIFRSPSDMITSRGICPYSLRSSGIILLILLNLSLQLIKVITTKALKIQNIVLISL